MVALERTRAIARWALAAASGKTAGGFPRCGDRAQLLERQGCLAALSAWLDEVPRLGGRTVLLGAEAGLGKTALLREFGASRAAGRTLGPTRRHWTLPSLGVVAA